MGLLFSAMGGAAFGQDSPRGIVVLGDSLTHWGDWKSLFPDAEITNCGMAGDTTEDVFARLGPAISSKPRKLFLLIGINDLLQTKGQAEVLNRYRAILKKIAKNSPATKVYVQSLLPVNTEMFTSSFSNEDLRDFSQKLQKIAEEKKLEYIDLFPCFLKDGQMDREYTSDGLHLSPAGYDRWKELIEKFVTE